MEWWQSTVVICAGVLTVVNLIEKIVSSVKKSQEPTKDLEKRIEELERKNEVEYKAIFKDYEKKITNIEEASKLTQRALLALLKHSLDGNNTDALTDVEKDLETFLCNK